MTETSSISKSASPLRDLKYRPFLILLTLGLFVRLALMFLYYPAVMLSFDSPRYARVSPQEFFGDFWMPAGYPLLLHLLHGVTRQLWFTIAIQHLLGLAAGVILYLTMSRLGLKRWIACLPAAVVFLSGDQLYLEHQLMADSFFIFLAIAGLGAAVAWMSGEKPGWLAVASVLLAMAALTRSVGVVCLPILLLVTTATVKGSLRHRGMTLAVALLPGAAVFVLYFAAFKLAHGEYAGLTDMSGWNLYSRVAPFADCREFTPPQGTAILCETTPSSQRPGPYGYVWDANSIARRHFALRPNDKLKAFSGQVVLHQPGDYLEAVAIDLLRYIEPSIVAPRGYSGQPREILSFAWRDRSVERLGSQSVVEKISRHQSPSAREADSRRLPKPLSRRRSRSRRADRFHSGWNDSEPGSDPLRSLPLWPQRPLSLHRPGADCLLRFSLRHSGRNLDRRFRHSLESSRSGRFRHFA